MKLLPAARHLRGRRFLYDPSAFVDRLDYLFEHNPWVAKRAATRRPFAGGDL